MWDNRIKYLDKEAFARFTKFNIPEWKKWLEGWRDANGEKIVDPSESEHLAFLFDVFMNVLNGANNAWFPPDWSVDQIAKYQVGQYEKGKDVRLTG